MKYRKLKEDERLQFGDQYYDEDAGKWVVVSNSRHGAKQYAISTYRRPLPSKPRKAVRRPDVPNVGVFILKAVELGIRGSAASKLYHHFFTYMAGAGKE